MIPRQASQVNIIDLRKLHPLDEALELMHFGFRGLTVEADRYLDRHGLTRVHHRILYILARRDDVAVGDLLAILGVSKQALHRPLKQLIERELVAVTRDPARHRFKLLSLTAAGRRLEQTATDHERRAMRKALDAVPPAQQQAWLRIMAVLAEPLRHG
jgi:DNA-binding MarR family transcriptional regulator